VVATHGWTAREKAAIAVVVRQGAETNVADARKWYSREDHHLGIPFVEEFARTVERIRHVLTNFLK
jgi:hypothetical protein